MDDLRFTPIITSRMISGWIILIIGFLIYLSIQESVNFKIGHNPELFILHIPINTPEKYITVVLFCFSNSIFRSLQHNILQPWITNHIQDTNSTYESNTYISSYEISTVSTIYIWFDFFMYMHILMSQIDLLLVEVSADVIMTILITNYYLRKKSPDNIKTNNEFEFSERSRFIREN